jgi:uncharacterized protein YegP (UPF0339 family)
MLTPRFQVFVDAAGGYRWRLVAANGVVVATSSESYTSRTDALRAAITVKAVATSAAVPGGS